MQKGERVNSLSFYGDNSLEDRPMVVRPHVIGSLLSFHAKFVPIFYFVNQHLYVHVCAVVLMVK